MEKFHWLVIEVMKFLAEMKSHLMAKRFVVRLRKS